MAAEPTSSALLAAISQGSLDNVKAALNASESDLAIRDKSGRTALHLAAEAGRRDIVEFLCSKNASVNATDSSGQTALQLAAKAKKGDVVGVLISAGASLPTGIEDAVTAVLSAARGGDLATVKKYVEAGAHVNAFDYDKRTALHLAASEGHLPVVEYLLSKDADTGSTDRWGGTPLMDAIRHKHDEVASALRSKGAKISFNQDEASAALCRAANTGDLKHIQRLIESGANPDASDYDHRAALHIAAGEGHGDIVKYLVSKGANVNVADRWGSTPIQDAQRYGHQEIMTFLTQNGAIVEGDVEKISESVPFLQSLQRALPLLSDKGQWSYAEVWLPAKGDVSVELSEDVWYASADLNKALKFRQATAQAHSEVHDLAASVLTSKKSQWFTKDNLTKTPAAATAGFQSGVAAPVIYNQVVLAVIIFFDSNDAQRQQDASFPEYASRLVVQGLPQLQSKIKAASDSVFEEQKNQVYQLIATEGVFNSALIYEEVDYFYNQLGLDRYYFEHFSPQVIAKHIHTYIAGKKVARVSGDPEDIRINFDQANADFYLVPQKNELMKAVEQKIQVFLEGHGDYEKKLKNLIQFTSTNTAIPGGSTKLCLYFLDTLEFPESAPETEQDIWKLATPSFLRLRTADERENYQKFLNQAASQLAPLIRTTKGPNDKTTIVQIAIRRSASFSYLTALQELLNLNNLLSQRKTVEQFSNGIMIYTFHIGALDSSELHDFVNQASLFALVPQGVLAPLLLNRQLTANETVYAYVVWRFAYYFARSPSEEYTLLSEALQSDSVNLGRLQRMRKSMQREFLTEARIAETILSSVDMIRVLYQDFAFNHKPRDISNTLSSTRSLTGAVPKNIPALIKKAVASELDEQILLAFYMFNQNLLKTNFYKRSKAALSFRLDPKFLAGRDLPEIPFGFFFVLGRDFRGFHIRFRDIARGGIRLVRSATEQGYRRNREFLFDENYGLANTQQKKNKDIPEGGSKGTILPSFELKGDPELCFRRYIDCLLDLLLKDDTVIDLYGKPEILFLGPDEGTADLMDWAALHAKSRGASFWKAFTTGKSVHLGGIPHDTYGMTTRGVHQYVVGILKKLNIKEESVTKFQTGGPDGDLGSNEIKISKDKTIGIVDGSGVLCDPDGINRPEIERLANARKMVKEFDKKLLGPQGFLVLIEEKDIVLPDGTKVESGMMFRNEFHLLKYCGAELFVPCGGRPEAVNANNFNKLLLPNGSCRFKYIVEGANLFFTQEARLALEKLGVILFKDSSANKGGVTSSSLEVLGALALSDEEHKENMCVHGTEIPEFYKKYVEEVQNKIEDNARIEFECMWKEHEQSKQPFSIISDLLSQKINVLEQQISVSKLWNNAPVRTRVLSRALPKTLVELLGLETVIKRVPEAYLRAIMASYIGSHYVYTYGLQASEFTFFEFMQSLAQ